MVVTHSPLKAVVSACIQSMHCAAAALRLATGGELTDILTTRHAVAGDPANCVSKKQACRLLGPVVDTGDAMLYT
jgi:hypothetical protein